MHKRIIFDADLTMGVADCDVDDGLALMYALGYEAENPDSIEIVGLTTTYGNNRLPVVYDAAERFCESFSLSFPVLLGAPDCSESLSEAAYFLVEQANATPGEISLVVTGSTTNLKGAQTLDEEVLSKFKEIVFMGGITEPLVFNDKTMDELNFSCDAKATLQAFEAANEGARIVVMTANNCLPAFFTRADLAGQLESATDVGAYVYQASIAWLDTMWEWYGLDGFVCWDVLASAYVLEPELFADQTFSVTTRLSLLEEGILKCALPGEPSAPLITPQIKDPSAFCKRALQLWKYSIER